LDKISFPYRSNSHLTLLHVVAESGAWQRYGLDVDYDRHISSEDAHRAVPAGEVEFVGGNHVSTYGRRARGDSWVYLGQTVNQVNHQLVVRANSGINGLADLHGRKVGTRGSHPGLNDWLYLKQHGLDVDRDDIELVSQTKLKKGSMDAEDAATRAKAPPTWQWVRDGVVDAALLGPPASLFAKAAGLKVIDIEPLPMIQFTTVSSSLGFVRETSRHRRAIPEGAAGRDSLFQDAAGRSDQGHPGAFQQTRPDEYRTGDDHLSEPGWDSGTKALSKDAGNRERL
jgi:hypothetical protein